jgi:hypothetical protein
VKTAFKLILAWFALTLGTSAFAADQFDRWAARCTQNDPKWANEMRKFLQMPQASFDLSSCESPSLKLKIQKKIKTLKMKFSEESDPRRFGDLQKISNDVWAFSEIGWEWNAWIVVNYKNQSLIRVATDHYTSPPITSSNKTRILFGGGTPYGNLDPDSPKVIVLFLTVSGFDVAEIANTTLCAGFDEHDVQPNWTSKSYISAAYSCGEYFDQGYKKRTDTVVIDSNTLKRRKPTHQELMLN